MMNQGSRDTGSTQQPTDDGRLAYSVDEVARVTGKTAPAIRADIDRGVLKARRWGRRVVVLREDVVAFLQGLPSR